MTKFVSAEMRDPRTPASVKINTEAREPVTDPTLGIRVAPPGAPGTLAKHRLVTLGDSLTHGCQSAAVHNTEISFPRIIAWEMGWSEEFRYPRAEGPGGGLPVNMEYVIRRLEREFGDKLDWWELAGAGWSLHSCMDEIEDYWERGAGSVQPTLGQINHNLGIYNWDIRDALSRTSRICRDTVQRPADNWLAQVVDNHNDRAALRVLPPLKNDDDPGLSSVDAAAALGKDGGIETLTVFLGANNALGAIIKLDVVWTEGGYRDLDKKREYTVWDPEHFAAELGELVSRIERIDARHVIWATVPHVTIAPLARGVRGKARRTSRYFSYYTRPWIDDDTFDPDQDPHITENQARAIDSAIDQYNDAITAAVKGARLKGLDWYLLDTAGVLDRMATRRYIEDPEAKPSWWRPYDLPPELQRLDLDTRFFSSGPDGRTQGGMFSLDGIHPTTVAYGIIAQEFINVMQLAGVPFYDGTNARRGRVMVDFKRLIMRDTLISDPPRSLASDVRLIRWIDQKLDLLTHLL